MRSGKFFYLSFGEWDKLDEVWWKDWGGTWGYPVYLKGKRIGYTSYHPKEGLVFSLASFKPVGGSYKLRKGEWRGLARCRIRLGLKRNNEGHGRVEVFFKGKKIGYIFEEGDMAQTLGTFELE